MATDLSPVETLIAIVNNQADWERVTQERWYRIPITSVNKRLLRRWPPAWLGFYHTKIFREMAYQICHYSPVLGIQEVSRQDLFPHELPGAKSRKRYYKLNLGSLQTLPQPILSRRRRRLIFIPTTYEKLLSAVEINDLVDESPLEDRLWAELKRLEIAAERQELVKVGSDSYFLDFAIYCAKGNLNIETDGDTWHNNVDQVKADKLRDNALEVKGWHTLRFTTQQVREKMASYCLPTITQKINGLGGLGIEGKLLLNVSPPPSPGQPEQLNLFRDLGDSRV